MPKNKKGSRESIVRSFNRIVLQKRYHEIFVADIIAAADVSRSTFYQHFHNKDDLLRASIEPIVDQLATAGFTGSDDQQLERVLEHFGHNRDQAKAFLQADICQQIVGLLAEQIASRIVADPNRSNQLPNDLVPIQVAEVVLGMIRAWLSTEVLESPQSTAATIIQVVRMLIDRHKNEGS